MARPAALRAWKNGAIREGGDLRTICVRGGNRPKSSSSYVMAGAPLMNFILRKLRNAALFAGALVFLFEEWLWDRLTTLTAWVGRLPGLRALEATIARLPPYACLFLLVLPALLLYPVKIGALWMIVTGRTMLGGCVMIAAKLASTAIVARFFSVCRPQLLRLPWFARLYDRILGWRVRIHAWLATRPAWNRACRAVTDTRLRCLGWIWALRAQMRRWNEARASTKRGALVRWRARRRAQRAAGANRERV